MPGTHTYPWGAYLVVMPQSSGLQAEAFRGTVQGAAELGRSAPRSFSWALHPWLPIAPTSLSLAGCPHCPLICMGLAGVGGRIGVSMVFCSPFWGAGTWEPSRHCLGYTAPLWILKMSPNIHFLCRLVPQMPSCAEAPSCCASEPRCTYIKQPCVLPPCVTELSAGRASRAPRNPLHVPKSQAQGPKSRSSCPVPLAPITEDWVR